MLRSIATVSALLVLLAACGGRTEAEPGDSTQSSTAQTANAKRSERTAIPTSEAKSTSRPPTRPPVASGIPGLTFGYIKGLANLEGFECESSTAAGFGWFCTKQTDTAMLVLQAAGPNASTVKAVGAEATMNGGGDPGLAEMQYLSMVTGIEYEGSDPNGAATWVIESKGSDVVEADFGPAHFVLRAPSGMRIAILDIEAP